MFSVVFCSVLCKKGEVQFVEQMQVSTFLNSQYCCIVEYKVTYGVESWVGVHINSAARLLLLWKVNKSNTKNRNVASYFVFKEVVVCFVSELCKYLEVCSRDLACLLFQMCLHLFFSKRKRRMPPVVFSYFGGWSGEMAG